MNERERIENYLDATLENSNKPEKKPVNPIVVAILLVIIFLLLGTCLALSLVLLHGAGVA